MVQAFTRHTSVVVFGKEIYYGPYNAGPGIQVAEPGRSHVSESDVQLCSTGKLIFAIFLEQHGRPMLVEDMGETYLDEPTFWEFIDEVKHQYTGDRVRLRLCIFSKTTAGSKLYCYWAQYHLLDFNCNGFTNDCVGFLTGGSIPSFVKGGFSSRRL